jgi:hypothetical protein
LTKLIKNIKLYSKLLISVGQQGRGLTQKPPLSPVMCGELIQRLMTEENEDKYEIAERLDLGRPKDNTDIYKKRDISQVNNFLTLLNVSEKSRDYAGWGHEPLPRIPFSTICETASLTHEEQDKILQSALKGTKKSNILKKDILKFKKWRINNPKLSVDEGIEKILHLKPVTNITHVIVCEISNILKSLFTSTENHQKKIIEVLQNRIKGKFYDVETNDILLTIAMDEESFKTFHDQQFNKGISFSEYINNILEEDFA